MKNISYKVKLLFFYSISVILVVGLIYNLLTTLQTTSIGKISKENFKTKAFEREGYLHDFFSPYFTTIKSIKNDKNFINYLSGKISQKNIENYFLSAKQSLPCLTQVRYIDMDGNEKIRIEGTPIAIKKEQTISKIVSKQNLQNKLHKTYIQRFLKLKNNEVGLSEINLNKEYGKIVIPKQPTLRLGMVVYDDKNNKKGIIILNICLRTFFKLINQTTLYHVHFIDEKGRYLTHHDTNHGLIGDDIDYSIFDEFPTFADKILKHDQFYGENFFSYKVRNFQNGQNIKLILELKFDKELKNGENVQDIFILFTIIFAIILFLVSLYLSKLPDLLREKAQKDKFISKLTSLPNRLALMKDLANHDFEHSIIIILSINNVLKIQNTYGYTISNNIVQQLSQYLLNYDDSSIQRIYANSYNIFSIKYKYKDDNTLKIFLKDLIDNIENNPFSIKIDNIEVEFLLEVTIGVSDPHKINNDLEELNEAENALEYALEKHNHLEIFTSTFHQNIKQNKENIQLAKKIKKSIDEDMIILHYQPIYNNFTEKIEKYEALIRIESDKALLYPDEFLPIAKQINKYNTLSYIVVDKAFKYFQDKPYEFSINLSITDIENIEFQEYLIERMSYYNIENKLVLEIVEQEGIENYDEFFEFIKKIKKHGCKIAIDDFGSGYSNFEYIINLSDYIDYLKIDGSLIKNLSTDFKSQALVGSLKFLCDQLNIKTIAEYVEDENIFMYLKSIGIDYSQGYYIGKPQSDII